MSDIVEELRRKVFRGPTMEASHTNTVEWKAAAEIERLQSALEPFSKLFLYPDDLGFEAAEDIRADQDWDEDDNDMQTAIVFVLRRDIRRARVALEQNK